MSWLERIEKSLGEITEISLLLIALGVVIEILFGDAVPFFGRVATNLTGLLSTLGENGLVGLIASGIIFFLFYRAIGFATYEEEDFETALIEGAKYPELIREDQEKKLERSNNTLVNNQIESVKQATRIKINKANETIRKLKEQGKTEEDAIVRLHRGRVRNLQVSMEEKVNELEQKRPV